MGMFDLDDTLGRGVNLAQKYPTKQDKFIVWGLVEILRELDIPGSDLPPADKVIFECSEIATPDERFEGGVIGKAITDKASQAEPSDFPRVCHLDHVPTSFGNDALILVSDYRYDRELETIPD